MYLSLKGSLGHTPITDRVGEGPLQIAEGAAAAYSLRNLGSDSPSVVRVRRESDNNERDFTAQDISTSVLTNWVNEQITPPLDLRELTATGRDGAIIEAAAAYSLRNLSDSYAGDVVEVRRNSDSAVRSFTAAEVTDGTLTTWVLGDVASLVGDARYFNGVDNSVVASSLPSISASEDFSLSFYVVTGSDVNSIQGLIGNFRSSANRFQCSISGGYIVTSFYTTSYTRTKSVPIEANTSYFVEISQSGTTLSLTVNGVVGLAGTRSQSRPSRQFTVGCLASSSSYFTELNGIIYDVKVFDEPTFTSQVLAYTGLGTSTTAWQDTIGSNDGTESNGTTFTGQGFDGTVSKWYDQSTTSGTPNAKHAVQTDAASQPKIVDAGSLVAGGLDFAGGAKHLDFTPFSTTNETIFVQSSTRLSNAFSTIISGADNRAVISQTSSSVSYNVTAGAFASISAASVAGKQLFTFNRDGTNVNFYQNGSLLGSNTTYANRSIQRSVIGRRGDTEGNYAGSISEFIIYNTDQTDNRTALEANIGEVYGIAGIPAYDDTVNGFVETWYDQSGNGNNATQLTAGLQPKIVDAGSLVSGGIDFLTSQSFDANISVTRSHLFSVFRSPNVVTNSSAVHLIDNVQTFQTVLFSLQTPTKYERYLGSSYTQDVVSMNTDGTDNLVSALNQTAVQGGSSLHINGSPMTIATTDSDGSMVINRIGKSLWADSLNQVMAELIIYNSDQTANRPAIEANINNQYDIY